MPGGRPAHPAYPGQRFGRLTLIERAGSVSTGAQAWRVRCDCGTEKVVSLAACRTGNTRSCGCLRRENGTKYLIAANVTHGACVGGKSREYKTWLGIISRCYNPKCDSFANYGGRGIRVCVRWLHSFENFLADMGPKPGPHHSVERADCDGDYSPENCRWATPLEQSRNTRRNRRLTINGETLCLAEWAERVGLNRNTLQKRLASGWPAEAAVMAPRGAKRRDYA
jgi:hypothetical protein